MPPSLVKKLGTAGGSGVGNPAITIPAAGVAVGNLVVYAIQSDTTLPTSCSDSRGNTYTVGTQSNGNTAGNRQFWSYITTALQSGDTITPSGGVGNNAAVAAEFTGLLKDTGITFDRNAIGTGATGTTWTVGPAASVNRTGDDLEVFSVGAESAQTVVADANYTLLDSFSSTGGCTIGWGYRLAGRIFLRADPTSASVAHDGVATSWFGEPPAGPIPHSPMRRLAQMGLPTQLPFLTFMGLSAEQQAAIIQFLPPRELIALQAINRSSNW